MTRASTPSAVGGDICRAVENSRSVSRNSTGTGASGYNRSTEHDKHLYHYDATAGEVEMVHGPPESQHCLVYELIADAQHIPAGRFEWLRVSSFAELVAPVSHGMEVGGNDSGSGPPCCVVRIRDCRGPCVCGTDLACFVHIRPHEISPRTSRF